MDLMLLQNNFDTDDFWAAERAPIRQPVHQSDRKTVLLVDDDPEVRSVTKTYLRVDGYTVLEARDAIEALLVSDRHKGPINLLLTDVNMPRTNGHQLAAKLRREQPMLRVMLTSGDVNHAAIAEAVHGSDVAFLAKPFNFFGFSAKVRELLAD